MRRSPGDDMPIMVLEDSMRLLIIAMLLCALPAVADEAEEKRAVSRPGVMTPFPAGGRSLSNTVESEAMPATWLKTLKAWREAGRAVILPSNVPADGFLVSGATWYSLKWQEEGRHVILQVNAAGLRLPGLEEIDIDPEKILIGRSHALVSADARIHGLAVRIDIECRRGLEDPSCGDDDSMFERFENLAVLK